MRTVNNAPHLGAKLFDIRGSVEVLESIVVQANPIYDHYLRLHGQEIALELYRIDQKLNAIVNGLREAHVVPASAVDLAEDDQVPPQFC